MSETRLGRALEFMSQPPDVEVLRDGTWILGWMVGWRQEEGSSCRVMVRVSEQGTEKTAWADLHDVRLPQYRGCPRTQSLPLLPRLPAAQTAEMTRSALDSGWNAQRSDHCSAEPVTFHAPRVDAGTGRTSSVRASSDYAASETGRHRVPAGMGGWANGNEVRPPESVRGAVAAPGRPRKGREQQAEAPLRSWRPSTAPPPASPVEVAPTRLLPLPAPRLYETAAQRPGGVTAY